MTLKIQSFIKNLSNSVSEADIATAEKVGIFTGRYSPYIPFQTKKYLFGLQIMY